MQKKTCIDCGKPIYKTSIRCKDCFYKSKKRVYLCKDCATPISYNAAFYGLGVCKKCSTLYISKTLKNRYSKTSHHSKGIKHPERSGKNHPLYKDGRSLKEYFCADCSKKIYRGSTRCKSCANKLENNPNWQGGTALHPYDVYFSKELKEQILNRDSYMCKICGLDMVRSFWKYGTNLQIHHIDYNKQNCNSNNLVTLCCSCHIKTNYNRNYWKAVFQYIMDTCLTCNKFNYCNTLCAKQYYQEKSNE